MRKELLLSGLAGVLCGFVLALALSLIAGTWFQKVDWHVVSNLLLVALTAVYATLTLLMLTHMKKVREDETAPDVRVLPTVKRRRGGVDLFMIVENIGRDAAYDVRIVFNPSLVDSNGGSKSDNLFLLKEGVDSIPPNRTLPIKLGILSDYLRNDRCHKHYDVTISYRRKSKKKPDMYARKIDLRALEGLNFPTWMQPFVSQPDR
jgi:hypothetical protein